MGIIFCVLFRSFLWSFSQKIYSAKGGFAGKGAYDSRQITKFTPLKMDGAISLGRIRR